MPTGAVGGAQPFKAVTLYGPSGQKTTVTSQQQETQLEAQGYTTSPNGNLTTSTSSSPSNTEVHQKHHGTPKSHTLTKKDANGKVETETVTGRKALEAAEAEGWQETTTASGGFATTSSGSLFPPKHE